MVNEMYLVRVYLRILACHILNRVPSKKCKGVMNYGRNVLGCLPKVRIPDNKRKRSGPDTVDVIFS
jgi:hypothetical protein